MIDLQVRPNHCFPLYFEPNFRKNYPSVLNRNKLIPKFPVSLLTYPLIYFRLIIDSTILSSSQVFTLYIKRALAPEDVNI